MRIFFEALTAKDRPYKIGKTLSESPAILSKFKENGRIGPDLFDVFAREKIYLKYAQQLLDPAQIDNVDHAVFPWRLDWPSGEYCNQRNRDAQRC